MFGSRPIPATTPSTIISRPAAVCENALVAARPGGNNFLSRHQFDSFLSVNAGDVLSQIPRKKAFSDFLAGEDHHHVLPIHGQGRSDLGSNKAATYDGKPAARFGQTREDAGSPRACGSKLSGHRRTGGVEACRPWLIRAFRMRRRSPRGRSPAFLAGTISLITRPRWTSASLSFVLRQTHSSGSPFHSPFESGGRLYGASGSALMIPMLPVASTSRMPSAAAAAVMPPPMIKYR